MWYKRAEAQKRYTFFFVAAALAAAFGGLLAAAIGKMDNMRGFRGWRWIFILEGCLTCVVALFCFALLPDFPEQSRWLTEEERAFVVARLRSDQGSSAVERPITARDVANVFRDWKVFLGGFMYFGLVVPAYGYAYFAPTIIHEFGYTPIGTQLHSVPPWVGGFGSAMLVAALSDRLKHRYLFTLIPTCVAVTGFAILLSVHHRPKLQYAALFLVTTGLYSALPVTLCWFTMNLGGHHRRAIGTAWQLGVGNMGGFVSTYAFLARDAPAFRPGYAISIAFACLSAAVCAAYFCAVWAENRTRAAAAREKPASDLNLNLTDSDKAALGDLSPEFRYQL
ncbi:hypothetical protein GP486_007151 [Trichoglossum hirsutum]|uniref:Major facilitator superfamily (MFS) profile domain-containing protein n=1 Tax=Trichoglossum hirsutum TaxID=265104 RepID=A0A9P8IGA7_9PEZI|nr:hypothetical protein GP486_007151 [Trichoglossum hirsutum]